MSPSLTLCRNAMDSRLPISSCMSKLTVPSSKNWPPKSSADDKSYKMIDYVVNVSRFAVGPGLAPRRRKV